MNSELKAARKAADQALCDSKLSGVDIHGFLVYFDAQARERTATDLLLKEITEALRANVMARRNQPGGCCDWSCPLCEPLANLEGE